MASSSIDWYERWRIREESEGLTWGLSLDGTQFYDAFLKSGSRIDENNIVCEIGPGYGRIFDTFSEKFSFKKWYMVEINPKRSEDLKQKYKNDPRVVVLCQNVDFLELPEKFDVGISSLTIKHLYPDCSIALANLSRHMNKDGFFVFDIIISDKDHIIFEEGNIVNYFAEDTLKDFINFAGLFVEVEDIIDYPVGPRNMYRVGKRTLSKPVLEKNEQNRERLSLERKCRIMESYCITLYNKVQRVKKSIPYQIMHKLQTII